MREIIDYIKEEYGIGGLLVLVGFLLVLVSLGVDFGVISSGPQASRLPLIFIGVILIITGLCVIFWKRFFISDPTKHIPDKDLEPLKNKLGELHSLKENCPFVLLGSVYLDVILEPIETTKLEKDEWSNIDPIEVIPGGSSLWVGRYLWRLCDKQQSYVFSKIGKNENDLFTREFDKLIKRDQQVWLLEKNDLIKSGGNIGTTVHLVQPDKKFTTMFTHQGVLATFGWGDIFHQLMERLSRGGVLHVSGYFKTNLWGGLVPNLGAFRDKTLICIDHGRLIEKLVHGSAMQTLYNAFDQGVVDIYFCTYQELLDYCRIKYGDRYPSRPRSVERTLKRLASRAKLPSLTIVRDDDLGGKVRAYAIIGKTIIFLAEKERSDRGEECIGSKNAFNAAMMYHLVKGLDPKVHELDKVVEAAGKRAFEAWCSAAGINIKNVLKDEKYVTDSLASNIDPEEG